jgi:energy-coupling factor transporter ATP-binding protein EcfA2
MKTINLVSQIINDKYTEYVYDAFDIQDKDKTSVSIPYDLDNLGEFDWNIGVIVGGSGSGKTSILKTLGDLRSPSFKEDKALISNFDWLEPKDAALILTSIGLSSVPTWLRPFSKLSNGEQYRASLAYLISSSKDGEVVIIDEYTSVVDRDVAKAMSFALQKYIRRENKRIILASCHYDILEWLMPDWTCSPQKGGALERGEWLRQGRPAIELQVSRVKHKAWDIFKKHHYMSESSNKAFMYLMFEWNKKPIAIAVVGIQVGKGMGNAYRDSRIVVLPDYQGLGIGTFISNFLGGISKSKGYRYFAKTIHPALGEWRNGNSNTWRPTSYNGKERNDRKYDTRWSELRRRKSYCHEYIGEAIDGYDNLLMPINHYRTKNQLTLF